MNESIKSGDSNGKLESPKKANPKKETTKSGKTSRKAQNIPPKETKSSKADKGILKNRLLFSLFLKEEVPSSIRNSAQIC